MWQTLKAEADEQMEALRNQLEDQTSTNQDTNFTSSVKN